MDNTTLVDSYYFLFWFYDTEGNGEFDKVTEVEVIAKDYEQALRKASKFDDRKNVFLKRVVENKNKEEVIK